jgi:hypothetical protein
MASIQYTINQDASGKAIVTVTPNVQTIGPTDDITFVTDTSGAAIFCGGGSPFVKPAAGETYSVPMRGTPSEPLRVTNAPEACQWVCGQLDANGKFMPWPGEGLHFPTGKPD